MWSALYGFEYCRKENYYKKYNCYKIGQGTTNSKPTSNWPDINRKKIDFNANSVSYIILSWYMKV